MVQRYDLIVDDLRQIEESEDGYLVEYGDYERLRQKAEALVLESAKIYAAYNKLVSYDDFMDMQTIQELADLV